MTFLSPLGFVWLGSLPVLAWLWRLASTRTRTIIPSLIPFEHLLAKASQRRKRLHVNLLFWLQALALMGVAAALAQPAIIPPRTAIRLVVLDTSASMGARLEGLSRFDRAMGLLRERLSQRTSSEQVFIMTTAPIAPLLPHPTGERAGLEHALRSVRVSRLGGSLNAAEQIGRSLLGRDPDETLVVTDEPPPLVAEWPSGRVAGNVQWIDVGGPLPNVAIVGVDAGVSLCEQATPSVAATLHNFSDEPVEVVVRVRQGGASVATERVTLAPRAQATVPLTIPGGMDGVLDLALETDRDALAADNHAQVTVSRAAALPVVLRVQDPALSETLSSWMRACEPLQWSTELPTPSTSSVLLTDTPPPLPFRGRGAVLEFHRPADDAAPVAAHWMTLTDHPLGRYLPQVGRVSARLASAAPGERITGVPVVAALVQGRRLPVLVADETGGRRVVRMFSDPVFSRQSHAAVLMFLNSLRWLMEDTGDGVEEGRLAAGELAGESNLMDRVSTWHPITQEAIPAPSDPARRARPLSPWLIWLVCALLLVEWVVYSRRVAEWPTSGKVISGKVAK